MIRASHSTQITIAMGLLFSMSLAFSAPSSAPFLIDYSAAPDSRRLAAFEEVILYPSVEVDVDLLKQAGTKCLAYISVVELAEDVPFRRAALKESRPLGRNEVWGTDLMDVSDEKWRAFLVMQAKQASDRGFEGFFLDTLDSASLIPGEKQSAKKLRSGLIKVVKSLREAFPGKKIVVNRGFDVFGEIADSIDGVLIESVYRTCDVNSGEYLPVAGPDSLQLEGWIERIRAAGKEAMVVDYVPEHERTLAVATANKLSALGARALVTTIDLHGRSLAPLVEVPRRILVLFGWDESERRPIWAADTMTAERFQMPLEWLGYECDYLHIGKALPPDSLAADYAGVIFDGELDISYEQERWFASWTLQQVEYGVKVLFAGQIPFKQEDTCDAIVRGLDIQGTCEAVTKPDSVEIASLDAALMNYEAEVRPHQVEFLDLQAPEAGKPGLTLRCKVGEVTTLRFDPVFTADWGGLLHEPYVTFSATSNITLSLVDPFEFLQRIWPVGEFPAPDPTTRDGLRVVFSHIDGDGFASLSTVKRDTTCAEIVRDRILKRFPLPVTVSVVEANTRAVEKGLDTKKKNHYEDIARSMFLLPNVQAASHTYSHPYSWIRSDPDYVGLYEHRNLVLYPEENYQEVDYRREIEGSVRYIEEELLPEGKKCEMLLWSGNCRPPAEAIRIVDELGIENMNGGNTIISRRNPGLASVAPRTMVWDGALQIFAPNQNEYVYTNDWRGPFYGGFQQVIETFEMTEKPRRLKPVNIYYHFYSVSRMGAYRALEKIHLWVMNQPLRAMTARDFARATRDSRETHVFRTGRRSWVLANAADLRTFRLPVGAGYPDWAHTKGITGYRDEGGQRYYHTDGRPRVELTLSVEPESRLHLESSSSAIEFRRLDSAAVDFKVDGLRPGRIVFGGAPRESQWRVSVNGGKNKILIADREGRIELNLPNKANVKLTLSAS